MKYFQYLLGILLLAGLVSMPGRPPMARSELGGEIRSLWATRFQLATPEKIDQLVTDAVANHFNTLFVQVRGRGESLYQSSLEPRSSVMKDPQFDPLDYLVAQAHRVGLKVHAWMNVYYVWSDEALPVSTSHVVKTHPEWGTYDWKGQSIVQLSQQERQTRGAEGVFLDPALSEVRSQFIRLCQELWEHYPIDGIHLDYVRYPGERWGFHPESRKAFRAQAGVDPATLYTDKDRNVHESLKAWQAFRRTQVNSLVQALWQTIERDRPDLYLSAAVYPDLAVAREMKGQAWDEWLREGWVDFVVPMVYHTDPKVVLKQLTAIFSLSYPRSVVVGLGAWQQSRERLVEKIKVIKEILAQDERLAGFSLFSYDALGAKTGYLPYVKGKVFDRPVAFPVFAWKPASDLFSFDL